MVKLIQKLFSMPISALAISAAGAGAIISALIAENFFGVAPCILCLYQRVPYAIVIVLGLLAFFFRANKALVFKILLLASLAMIVDTGIAVFHSGVELELWAGTDECAVNATVLADPIAARMALLATAVADCSEPGFYFLGLTLANWNVFFTFALSLFALLSAFQPKLKCLQDDDEPCCTSCLCHKK